MTMRLRSLHGGAYTGLTLQGPIATVPTRRHVRRLLSVLSWWHGGRVDVVLSAGERAGWLEVWDDALVGARAARLRIAFGRGWARGSRHDG